MVLGGEGCRRWGAFVRAFCQLDQLDLRDRVSYSIAYSIAYVLAFGGMLPADLIPQGLGDLPAVPEGEHAEDVQLQRVVLLRDHLDKILESDNPSAKNPRREIHDRIVGVCAAMQRNVGIQLRTTATAHM